MPARLIPHKDGPHRWRVDQPASLDPDRSNPKRKRRFFRYREQAEAFAATLVRMGSGFRQLTVRETYDAREALDLLDAFRLETGGRYRSLAEAVRYCLGHWRRDQRSTSLGDLFEQFDLDLAHRGRSAKHRRSVGYTRNRCTVLWPVQVRQLTSEQIEAALAGLSRSSRDGHLRRIISALNYAIKRNYLTRNPALELTLGSPKRKRQVVILPLPQVERLLALTQQHRPKFLIYLVMALFTGVRIEELQDLTWADVRLAEGEVIVREEVSKTGDRRVVPLTAQTVQWLNQCRPTTVSPNQRLLASLSPSQIIRIRRKLWKLMLAENPSLPQHWPQGCLRRTFCSMHLPVFNDPLALVDATGHSLEVMMKHYRKRVEKSEAVKFWQIMPNSYVQTQTQALPT